MGEQFPTTTERSKGLSDFLARKQREREEAKAKAGARAGNIESRRGTADANTEQREAPHKVVVEDLPSSEKAKARKERQSPPPKLETVPPVAIPSAQARDMLIFMFNSLAALSIGEYARLTESEYKAIADPLERILQRLPAEASSKFGEYADPLMLIMGMGMWGFRVFYQVPTYLKHEQAKAAINEFERSISRDVPLDPAIPAVKKAKRQEEPIAGMKDTSTWNPNGATDAASQTEEIPTGIRPDMQQLWEQPLD